MSYNILLIGLVLNIDLLTPLFISVLTVFKISSHPIMTRCLSLPWVNILEFLCMCTFVQNLNTTNAWPCSDQLLHT